MKISKKIIFILTLLLIMMTACVQQNNTYPVEIFSEMHYNQAQKSQEPPRVPAHPDSVTFSEIGSEKELDMSSNPANNYNGSYLYEVNCTFCHGANGNGIGPAASKISSEENYWYKVTGEKHKNPANLLTSELSKDNAVVFIKGGAGLMPAYENMLTEAEIRAIVDYVWDDLR